MVSLERHADITPNYVTMVWEKLEEQNPVFFWSYGLHLQLKEQVSLRSFGTPSFATSNQLQRLLGSSSSTPGRFSLSTTSHRNRSTYSHGWGETLTLLERLALRVEQVPARLLRRQGTHMSPAVVHAVVPRMPKERRYRPSWERQRQRETLAWFLTHTGVASQQSTTRTSSSGRRLRCRRQQCPRPSSHSAAGWDHYDSVRGDAYVRHTL